MFLNKIRNFFSGNKIVIVIVFIIIIIVLFAIKNGNNKDISITTPSFGDLTNSVHATGQVTSKTDLDLSFERQGIVKVVNVEVGDKIKKGAILSKLDTSIAFAKITEAKGALAIAEAKLQKILDGYSNEEIALAKIALINAQRDYKKTKNTQDTLVKNAYSKLLNSTLEAESMGVVRNITTPVISGTYNLEKEGAIYINVYSTSGGFVFYTSGLVNSIGSVNTTNPQPIGAGLYILFSSTDNLNGSKWVINIPNKKTSDYLANQNAYDSALKTKESAISSAQSLVDQRKAELDIKLADARSADIDLAKAEVISARGSLERVQADYRKSILRAPSDGTITKVDVKYGELVNAGVPIITLQDINNLYIETNINESNIASIKLNQPVEITFDALVNKKFNGVVSHIDPSSITKDGIVNYKIKILIENFDKDIRPGMNAETTIITSNKKNILSIPKAYIIERNGRNYVNTVTDSRRKNTQEREITLGSFGDGNMVEVISGLSIQDKIARISNK